MQRIRGIVWTGLLLMAFFGAGAQRIYAPHSVLATGSWYKIAAREPGIYKLELTQLGALGINTGNLTSSSFRFFGHPSGMLPEANNGTYFDDLTEIAVQVVDGGDGLLNNNDYILFYHPGADEWLKDSINQSFTHKKNRYTSFSYYFITFGGNGKRVQAGPMVSNPAQTVTSFNDRLFYESDTINLLAGGKEWYGEEFTNAPGKTLARSFPVSIPNYLPGAALTFRTNCIARSVGAPSRFDIRFDNQPLGQLQVNPVSGGQYDPYVQSASFSAVTINNSANPVLGYSFTPGSFNAQGWLNWYEVFTRRTLSMNGVNQLLFRDWSSVNNSTAGFIISQATTNMQVWDITEATAPRLMPGQQTGTEYRFTNTTERLKEYVVFTSTGLLQPQTIGQVSNQDLHAGNPAEMLIITHPDWTSEAQRLAAFHQQQQALRSVIATTEQIYNEFAGGRPDPVAVRDFVKMYYDKFGTSVNDKPRYLLLFGDASFDYRDRINNNTNFVPAWQSEQSTDPLSTYTSDDFFGFLDSNEDINSGTLINYLDVGIGRVPARTITEARQFVDKLIVYADSASMGPWRNTLTFIADDEDGNLHVQDAEQITATTIATAPGFNLQKIYLDAYQQESGAGGSRYPEANLTINNQVLNGTLIWNYSGHGGSSRLAEETILDQSIINSWNNKNRLPLFITATCDFAPYDNPVLNSIGENLLLRPVTGAIALMTTTRPVFAFSNRVMNNNYLRFAMQAGPDGQYPSLGEAVKSAKNFTYQTLPDITNNRKFTLLGDPAMTLAFPVLKVKPTLINSIPVSQADTLSAGETVTMEGEVTDNQGNRLSNYNGFVYPVIFDKPQTVSTRGNDPGSQAAPFQVQQNSLFRGKFSVTDGRFSFRFRVPKDIGFQYGNGRLSLYAENGKQDAQGLFTNFLVGGIGQLSDSDTSGPVIKAWLNDERFANGGLTNQLPVLIVKMTDSSGINTTGLGIGHDLVATLDGDNNQYFLLNDFYQADADSYQRGGLRYQLPEMTPGPHTLRIKAWDIMNNSGEYQLDFIVGDDGELEISHVLNYPNPFTTQTSFWFEHNKPGQSLQVQLQILTISGRVIRTFSQTLQTEGNRVTEISWDGKDDYGNRPGRGVYLYKLRVIGPPRKVREVLGKLVML